MALREEFERDGDRLFRMRSYLPLLLAVLFVLAMLSPGYSHREYPSGRGWEAACLAVSLMGLAVRIYTIGHTPAGTSGRNTGGQVADSLNTTGIYSVVRHPLYLGNLVIWIGVSMYPRLWWVTLLTILLFWVYYERIMYAEEEFLRRSFSGVYSEWADRTPAIIPRLAGWRKASLGFSLRNVLKREYSGFFAIIASFTFLDMVSGFIGARTVAPDPMWRIIFAAGALVAGSLRILKHKTDIFSVEGR